MDRKQVGLRFQPGLWMDYRQLCASERIHPNDLLERTMQVAVEAGSVRASIDRVSAVSEGEELVDAVVVRKLLLEIDELVDHGYWMIFRHEDAGNLLPDEQEKQAPYPDLAPAIENITDRLLPKLKRVHDKPLLAQAKHSLERAQAYVRDIEKPTDADYDPAKDEIVESLVYPETARGTHDGPRKVRLTWTVYSRWACGSPGEIRTPVDGFLPYSNGPKPVTGRACVPLLVRYTTGLQSALASD